MPTTPTYALPYPVDTDPVDVAGDIEALALAVDTAITTGAGSAGGYKTSFLLMGG
jgi:hypothetical protein